jgi:Na+-transporting NADH:ubiquinone oxidoreductase subunit C
MSDHLRSIVFAAIVCVVCSLLLTAANTGLKPFQQRNLEVDRQKNILKALGLIQDGQGVESDRVQTLYKQSVQRVLVGPQGQIQASPQTVAGRMPLYLYIDNDRIKAYVVPIDTRGLWGAIHGYLAIDNDGATIRGFTVYNHSETPGLGGEIESRWFRKNFIGKKIVGGNGDFVSIGIAKGAVKDQVPPGQRSNYVDGISGATMTGRFLSAGMKEILKEYEPVAIQFRHHNPPSIR